MRSAPSLGTCSQCRPKAVSPSVIRIIDRASLNLCLLLSIPVFVNEEKLLSDLCSCFFVHALSQPKRIDASPPSIAAGRFDPELDNKDPI